MGFPDGSAGKESACSAGDLGPIPGLVRSPGERNGSPLQYSCLGNPMDYSLPGSSFHGILQAKILEWAAIPFSRVSSLLRNGIFVSHIAGRFSFIWVTREAIYFKRLLSIKQRGNKVILGGTHLCLWNANVTSGPFRNPYLCHLLKMKILKRG